MSLKVRTDRPVIKSFTVCYDYFTKVNNLRTTIYQISLAQSTTLNFSSIAIALVQKNKAIVGKKGVQFFLSMFFCCLFDWGFCKANCCFAKYCHKKYTGKIKAAPCIYLFLLKHSYLVLQCHLSTCTLLFFINIIF